MRVTPSLLERCWNNPGVGDACDACTGNDASGDGDGLCADLDCDDEDPDNLCPLFADGFESGGTDAWSIVSP